jgi:predicted DNA-binding protein with PD1-like motif
MVGTLAWDPLGNTVQQHLHLALADKVGAVWGGHALAPSEGVAYLPIFTTAEVTILVHHDMQFGREADPTTGFDELKVIPITRARL